LHQADKNINLSCSHNQQAFIQHDL